MATIKYNPLYLRRQLHSVAVKWLPVAQWTLRTNDSRDTTSDVYRPDVRSIREIQDAIFVDR